MDVQWRTRNGILHNQETGMEVAELRRRARRYYLNPHVHVSTDDLDLFHMPIESRLRQDPQCLELWVRAVEVAASVKRTEERHILKGVPDIWGFFGGVSD